jgi:uncharacterized membrane protein
MRRPTLWGLLILCVLSTGPSSLAGDGPLANDPINATIPPARDIGPGARTRIVNGRITGSQPSAGAVLLGQDPDTAGVACSGVLVGCDSFLTAGQCVCTSYPCDSAQIDPTQYKVFLQNGGIYNVSEVKVHPGWTIPGPDLAILKLSTPVNGIAPTRINTTQPVPDRSQATIVGFGIGYGEFGGIKRIGAVQTTDCQFLPSNADSICWWFEYPLDDPGQDSNFCFGDQGGPMFIDFGNGPVVVGTHSGGFSSDCSPPDFSWDTNIYTYQDFILSAVPDHGVTSCGDLPQIGSEQTTTADIAGELDAVTTSRVHSFLVPPDIEVLRVTMNSDSFENFEWLNIDLDLNYGVAPADGVQVACRREGLGNYASCEVQNPRPGTWYARVKAVSNQFSELYGMPVPYQVTASSFRTTKYAGVIDVALATGTGASWPGGVVPSTLRLQNKSERFQRTTLTAWVIPPSGPRYAVRKSSVPLDAGQTREIAIPVPVPPTAELGRWMLIVESNASGLIDKGWNSFEVQRDRAADVELSTPVTQIYQGESWDYTSTITNLSGFAKVAAAKWHLVDPQGTETTWEKRIPLAPGQIWTESATLDSPAELGGYALTLETKIDAYVATASIRFEVVPLGRATLTLIKGVGMAMAITPDGGTVVGNLGFLRGIPYGAYRLNRITDELEFIANYEYAIDVSDDGQTVLGQMPHPETFKPMAAIWNSSTYEWQGLGLLAPPSSCGMEESSSYGLSGDGKTAVGLAYSDQLGNLCDAFAFRWTAETGMQALPRRDDAEQARANAVDYDGNTIAGFENWNVEGNRRASRWIAVHPESASDYEDELLGSLYPPNPVNGLGEALAISRNGTWIGGDAGWSRPGVGGFLWSAQTGLIPIPNPRRWWSVWPTAVTDDGRTFTCVTGPSQSFYREACIWTADGGLKNLASWLTSLGADLSAVGGRLEFANDMTADGKTIVGHNNSSGLAWIAQLPTTMPGAPPAVKTPIEQPITEPAIPDAPTVGSRRLSVLK